MSVAEPVIPAGKPISLGEARRLALRATALVEEGLRIDRAEAARAAEFTEFEEE